ncbi:MAG: CoA-binding protein [Treponema sp.]|nr:CoA-binding protein [Treponema sp.]
MREGISEPTKRRLVLLEHLLSRMTGRVTSKTLSTLLGCKDSLIRHDIASIGFSKGFSNGYDVKELQNALLGFLPNYVLDKKERACIVGLGRLGAAFLDEGIFEKSGFTIVAGFDSNVNRTEILHSTFPLYPASRLETVIKAERIDWAILATKNEEALSIAERLSNCRIRGIVNYTDVTLKVPKTVALENASPVTLLKLLFVRGENSSE